MAHIRRQIREAIGIKLTGLALTGANVFQSRVYALDDTELPAILIATEIEDVEASSISYPRLQKRNLLVSIKALAKANADLDDVLDEICSQVEKALSADIGLNGLTKDLLLSSTNIALEGDGEKPIGVATMVWAANYQMKETAPDVAF